MPLLPVCNAGAKMAVILNGNRLAIAIATARERERLLRNNNRQKEHKLTIETGYYCLIYFHFGPLFGQSTPLLSEPGRTGLTSGQ